MNAAANMQNNADSHRRRPVQQEVDIPAYFLPYVVSSLLRKFCFRADLQAHTGRNHAAAGVQQ
ncbi:hypothetical protein [Candidatus Halocynthiibacter alkanivorans]|jgi:hypothetical protein|uniref:hypothetical protein n=1 Tax=Candidatus Halocynthiibacter alkanivorans TaxID=2267619 RepID=UPI000DF2B24D|nr:hypothetical protein [Candidatus Halocynthiibacter alkanivorans]